MDRARISIGLAGELEPGWIRALAPRIEAAGFRALWLNDTAAGDSLAGLAVAAEVTTTLGLATGVIPIDRRPASAIAASLGALALPEDRLLIGVGSGGASNALERVAAAVESLRAATGAPILVGALGPRMRRLGGEVADGVLLNWFDPAAAGAATDDLHRQSPAGHSALYVRTIVDGQARAALATEAARYESIPSYAANFARMRTTGLEAAIDGSDPERRAERVGEFAAAVDELVLRVITRDSTLRSYLGFLDALA